MTRGQPEDNDEDDGDECREEWSNDHLTQVYINSHQQQFRKIEEQEDLKEARLAEERERQRVVSSDPPRSAWMMAASTVPGPNTAMKPSAMPTTSKQNRSKVLGLLEPMGADVQDGPSSMQPLLEPQH